MANKPTKAAKQFAREVSIAKRRADVLNLRKQGWTFAQIGEHMGFSVQRAHVIANEALADLKREGAAETLELELGRLDELLQGQWQAGIDGDPRAVDAILKIMDRRARYLGVDAPQKIAGADGGSVKVDATINAESAFSEFVSVLGSIAARKAGGFDGEGALAGDGKAKPDTDPA